MENSISKVDINPVQMRPGAISWGLGYGFFKDRIMQLAGRTHFCGRI
jgi:hypothetical protein